MTTGLAGRANEMDDDSKGEGARHLIMAGDGAKGLATIVRHNGVTILEHQRRHALIARQHARLGGLQEVLQRP